MNFKVFKGKLRRRKKSSSPDVRAITKFKTYQVQYENNCQTQSLTWQKKKKKSLGGMKKVTKF